jgi:hypothetical protein
MNAKKKRLGTKAQIRAEKEKERKIATVIFTALILIATLFSVYFGYQILSTSSPPEEENTLPEPTLQFKPENPNPLLKAAIVDHLSLTVPNQTFVQTAATILTKANFTVDYFSGEKVTVNFYRNLPSGGYILIILRVHSAGTPIVGSVELLLFTCEAYSKTRYVPEQLKEHVGKVVYYLPRESGYFGISPSFVKECMKNIFNSTTIIMIGCDGLKGTQMAKAFIDKGAKAYIGWNGSVSASHTDIATTRLLQHLITEKQTIKQAIENTMKEIGPDPAHNSQLAYYPLEAGDTRVLITS